MSKPFAFDQKFHECVNSYRSGTEDTAVNDGDDGDEDDDDDGGDDNHDSDDKYKPTEYTKVSKNPTHNLIKQN